MSEHFNQPISPLSVINNENQPLNRRRSSIPYISSSPSPLLARAKTSKSRACKSARHARSKSASRPSSSTKSFSSLMSTQDTNKLSTPRNTTVECQDDSEHNIVELRKKNKKISKKKRELYDEVQRLTKINQAHVHRQRILQERYQKDTGNDLPDIYEDLNDGIQNMYDECNKENICLQRVSETSDGNTAQLRKLYQSKEREVQELKQEMERMSAKRLDLSICNKIRQECKQRVGAMQKECDTKLHQYQNEEQTRNALQTKLDELEDQCRSKNATIAEMKHEIADQKRQLAECETAMNDLRNAHSMEMEQCNRNQQESAQKANALSLKLDALSAEVEKVVREKQELEIHESELNHKYGDAKQVYDVLLEQNEALIVERDELIQRADDFDKECRIKQEEIDCLKGEHEHIHNERQLLTQQCGEMQMMYDDSENKYQALLQQMKNDAAPKSCCSDKDRTISELNGKIKTLTKQIDDKRLEILLGQQKCTTVRREYVVLESKYFAERSKWSDESLRFHEQVFELSFEADRLKEANDHAQCQSEIGWLQKQYKEYQQRSEYWSQQISILKKGTDDQATLIEEYLQQIKLKNADIKDMNAYIKRLQFKFESRKTANHHIHSSNDSMESVPSLPPNMNTDGLVTTEVLNERLASLESDYDRSLKQKEQCIDALAADVAKQCDSED